MCWCCNKTFALHWCTNSLNCKPEFCWLLWLHILRILVHFCFKQTNQTVYMAHAHTHTHTHKTICPFISPNSKQYMFNPFAVPAPWLIELLLQWLAVLLWMLHLKIILMGAKLRVKNVLYLETCPTSQPYIIYIYIYIYCICIKTYIYIYIHTYICRYTCV